MRIIDLLNKIANGEEVPKKIKWGVHIFKWNGYEYMEEDEFNNPTFNKVIDLSEHCLNDTVEILEKENKIEKLDMILISDTSNIFQNKINELIDEINKLKEDK